MDAMGFLLFFLGGGLYLWKRKAGWLFVCGAGAGLVAGALFAYALIMGSLR